MGGKEAREQAREVLLWRYVAEIQQFEHEHLAMMAVLRDAAIGTAEFEQRTRALYDQLGRLKELKHRLRRQPGREN